MCEVCLVLFLSLYLSLCIDILFFNYAPVRKEKEKEKCKAKKKKRQSAD